MNVICVKYNSSFQQLTQIVKKLLICFNCQEIYPTKCGLLQLASFATNMVAFLQNSCFSCRVELKPDLQLIFNEVCEIHFFPRRELNTVIYGNDFWFHNSGRKGILEQQLSDSLRCLTATLQNRHHHPQHVASSSINYTSVSIPALACYICSSTLWLIVVY